MPARPPPRRAAPRLTANAIAARAGTGIIVGQLLAIALDRLIGGPGPFALFGL
jgi:hypothetical protein